MKRMKTAEVVHEQVQPSEEMALISAYSKKPLEKEQVYLFSVCLCDNEVDRDFEQFTEQTLRELAPMFEGKSGIFDHSWSAKGQAARIYKTEVLQRPEMKTADGSVYTFIKADAYMVRTKENEGLIAEIEGGIKKEVSVGCSIATCICSICGQEMGKCEHVKGQVYGKRTCVGKLEGAKDAYEFSFVAVPAQKNAAVMKGYKETKMGIEAAVKGCKAAEEELETLKAQAQIGKKYLELLRAEVVRLGILAGEQTDGATLEKVAQKLDEGELIALREMYEKAAEKKYPLKPQFSMQQETKAVSCEDGAFLI